MEKDGFTITKMIGQVSQQWADVKKQEADFKRRLRF